MSDRLTAQEVADELGYHIEHVRMLLRLGIIKAEKFNRVWIIGREEVERVKALQSKGGRFYHGQTGKGTVKQD